MQELIDRISSQTGIDPAVATKATGIILDFLTKAGPPDLVAAVMAKMPGAEGAINAETASAGGGGLMGMVGGLMGSMGGMGGAMAAFTRLTEAGLDMGQVKSVTGEVVAYAKEKAGAEAVDQIIAAIPGLGSFVN